ncbi:MAG: MCE family protein [Deltaproteobacteria bacterium]|nr:MCE family protein [Deltaproteobacteria bacterium]
MALKREIKVGIFVLLGLIVAGAIIFMIGDERRVFDKHFRLHAAFDDVAGLKPGAPVRMGGVDVGTVENVKFSGDLNDKRLHVYFTIVRVAYNRVHDDSSVTISNKGLLGDKMLEVTQGTEGRPHIADGGEITAVPPQELGRFVAKADELADLAKKTLQNIEAATKVAADPKVADDLKVTLGAVRVLLHDAATHDGFVKRLMTDPKLAEHLDHVFIEAARAGKSFDAVANDVRLIIKQAKDGPGFAHTLLYSKDGEKIAKSLATASEELAHTLEAIRTGKGAAHELVYGEEGGKLAKDIEGITADIRTIVADVKAGKGTLGALLTDPSLYEDMKSILGNVERNQVLRAIVRYTIKQDETKPGVATQPPALPPATKAPLPPPASSVVKP